MYGGEIAEEGDGVGGAVGAKVGLFGGEMAEDGVVLGVQLVRN